jgi:tripartite-type tricarboxylate transporter receptor subunit TctC
MKKLVLALALILAVCGCAAFAADFPTKNIKLLVPFAAGGGTDAVARALASAAEKHLGQPVVVMNKAGGSGAVGMTEGATSKPDGYTVTMITREIAWLPQMGLAQITPENFDLIALANEDPAIMLVQPDSKFKSVKDVLDAAKAAPGTVKFGSTAKPNFYLLALELNQKVKFSQIPYNGAAEAIPALMGGHVEFSMVNPGEAISQITSGQLKPLGVCSDKRMAGLPDVPTMTELGYPIVTGTWRGLAVPKGTPDAVKAVLGAAFQKAVAEPDFVAFMKGRTLGIRFMNAKDFKAFVDSDVKALTEIVEEVKKQQQK